MNDFLKRPLRGPAIFNPDLLSKEELVGGFVARQDLLALFVEDLRRSATGGAVQHHLLLGQRGMGKTTLLRRLRHAVDDDPVLRDAWLPLTFPEEQYDVAHLSDFYLNCVDALSDALESRGKAEAARALDAAVASIPEDPEDTRAARALDLLIRTAKRQKARLLLLLDNIDLLFHRLDEHHWTLRELLSSQERLCVIGASAVAIETTYDYGKAFYDFFQVHHLAGLSEAECREVLLTLSRMFGTPQVEQWLSREPARLKALRVLTGGNPRTVVLLHGVAASSQGGDVRSDLERLLDHCTPLYKHRFEALSDQAQRVVHALALHWQPASAADMAEATRLDVNTVSSQLNRLVSDGVVEKVPFFPENKTGFQIAERFFNIWYLMRSSRRVRRRLTWLVEFLKMFYEGEEIRAHARHALLGRGVEKGRDDAIRFAESALAFADALGEEPLKKALEGAAAHALTAQREVRDKIAEIVDLEGVDASLKPVIDRHRAAAELREKILSAKVAFEEWDPVEFAELLGGSAAFDKEYKASIVERLETLTSGQLQTIVGALRREREHMGSLIGSNLTGLLRRATQQGYVQWPGGGKSTTKDCDDIDAAAVAMDAPLLRAFSISFMRLDKGQRKGLRAADLAPLLPVDEMPYGWSAYGVLLLDEGERAAAEKAFQKAIALGDPSGYAAWWLGELLASMPERLEDAENAYRLSVAAPRAGARHWQALGYFLSKRRKNFEEAVDAYQRALALEPSDAHAWEALGDILMDDLNRAEEAEHAYLRATEGENGNALYWRKLGNARVHLRRYSDAEVAFLRAIELDGTNSLGRRSLGFVLEKQSRFAEATDAYRQSVLLLGNDGPAWNGLAWNLYLAGRIDDEAEHAAREAVRLLPSDVNGLHTAATILTRRGKWLEARDLARRFLKEGSPDWHAAAWEDIVLFFFEAVRAGHAAEAGELLDETDLGERWLPLREALRIVAANNPLLLRKLAPEVREPARLLIDRLTGIQSPPAQKGESRRKPTKDTARSRTVRAKTDVAAESTARKRTASGGHSGASRRSKAGQTRSREPRETRRPARKGSAS